MVYWHKFKKGERHFEKHRCDNDDVNVDVHVRYAHVHGDPCLFVR